MALFLFPSFPFSLFSPSESGSKSVKALEDFGLDANGDVLKAGKNSVKKQNEKEEAARKRLREALRKGNMKELLEALKAARGVLADDDPAVKEAEQALTKAALKDDKLMDQV